MGDPQQPLRISQAAQIKARLIVAFGGSVEVAGEAVTTFPAPPRLLELRSFPGIPDEKIVRLHGVAQATLDGRLDAERLRALPAEEALAELRELRGIGAWGAQFILMRGAATADTLPTVEPRVRQAIVRAYGLAAPPDDEALTRMAEAWRPYRMWVCVLMRAAAYFLCDAGL